MMACLVEFFILRSMYGPLDLSIMACVCSSFLWLSVIVSLTFDGAPILQSLIEAEP